MTVPVAREQGTLADVLAPALGMVPETLLPADDHGGVLAVAAGLPRRSSTYFGMECPLSGPPVTPDFLACVVGSQIPELGLGLRALDEGLLNCWLEFDALPSAGLQGGAEARRGRNVFVGPREPVGAASSHRLSGVIAGLESLSGCSVPLASREAALRCVDAGPPDGGVFQAGLFAARRPAPLRLCVTGLEPAGVPPYLRDAGWRGDHGRLTAMLAEAGQLVDRIDADLDIVDGTVGSQLGLELSFSPKRPPRRERRWTGLIEWLVERRLCTAAKGRGLLGFPGHSWTHAALRQPHDGQHVPGLEVTIRGLSHIKVVLHPQGTSSAKGYLSVRLCRWQLREGPG